MEPRRAVDSHNGGVEAQNGAVKVCMPVVPDSHNFDKEKDPEPDPH